MPVQYNAAAEVRLCFILRSGSYRRHTETAGEYTARIASDARRYAWEIAESVHDQDRAETIGA